MAEQARLVVRINLGAQAPIEVVATVVGHLGTACRFGSELQFRVSRSEAVRQILRRRPSRPEDDDEFYPWERHYPYPPVFLAQAQSQFMSPTFERDVATWMRELRVNDDAEVLVERLEYSNPLEAVLVAAVGGVVMGLLKLLREWPAARRVQAARADDFEDEVRARKRVRAMIVEGISSGQLPIRYDWADELMSPDVVRALDVLSRRELEVEDAAENDQL